MLRPSILYFLNIQWEAHIDLKYIPSQQLRDGNCQLSVVLSSGCMATPRIQDIIIVISSTLFMCIGMSACVVTGLREWAGGSRELIHNQPLKSGVQREPCEGVLRWHSHSTQLYRSEVEASVELCSQLSKLQHHWASSLASVSGSACAGQRSGSGSGSCAMWNTRPMRR